MAASVAYGGHSSNCGEGYSCAYTNSISWQTPTRPLPMEINPQVVFERMFGDGSTAEERFRHRTQQRSILDSITASLADLAARDHGSRDSIHALAGVTWPAIDYADGLVRIGVQSSIAHPDTSALLRALMTEAGLPVPPEGRTLDSVCVTAVCR